MKKTKTTIKAVCSKIPKMFTNVKYQCSPFVLCLKMSMAGYPPKAPPKNESSNSVFSFVRYAPLIAFFLST